MMAHRIFLALCHYITDFCEVSLLIAVCLNEKQEQYYLKDQFEDINIWQANLRDIIVFYLYLWYLGRYDTDISNYCINGLALVRRWCLQSVRLEQIEMGWRSAGMMETILRPFFRMIFFYQFMTTVTPPSPLTEYVLLKREVMQLVYGLPSSCSSFHVEMHFSYQQPLCNGSMLNISLLESVYLDIYLPFFPCSTGHERRVGHYWYSTGATLGSFVV